MIEIHIDSAKPIPLQVDGEPWVQPGISKLRIYQKQPRTQAVMLKRIEHGIAEKAFVKTLNDGTERGILLPWQRDALLQKMEIFVREESEGRGFGGRFSSRFGTLGSSLDRGVSRFVDRGGLGGKMLSFIGVAE